jgi:hypothetical protein
MSIEASDADGHPAAKPEECKGGKNEITSNRS